MINEVILFSVFFGLGAFSRLWYRGLLALERIMKNRPAAITLEFLSVGLLCATAVFLLFVLNGGLFAPFILFAAVIGYMAVSILV